MVIDQVTMQLAKEFAWFCTNILRSQSESQVKVYQTRKSINLFPTINCIWRFCWEIAIGFGKPKRVFGFFICH